MYRLKRYIYFLLFFFYFIFIILELFCPLCYFLYYHNGHKIFQISNEKLLNDVNISIELSLKEFNDNIEKTKNLKEKIEKEINEIDKLYDKVYNEVTNTFKIKHEKLTNDENNLKEKLQNEVTKVKEKLEIFLSESNDIIKSNERINKGIKNLEKEIENNFVKHISYISKINKIQKENKKLFCQLMRNIKITFNEENDIIKYDYYYFNGIQIPKNIEFKEIKQTNFKSYWKIDNINILNIDNKKTKFLVEIKKENSNDKFIKIYEGNNTNCLVDNLISNTTYEIRICCINNELFGAWTEIQKIKTSNLDIDSIILRESKRENEFLEKIIE